MVPVLMAFKAYIFDIGGVLLDYDLKALVMRMADGDEERAKRLSSLRDHASLRLVESGKMQPVVYFEEHIKPVVPHKTYRDLVNMWKDAFSANEEGVRLFRDLKRAGQRVFLLSNLARFNLDAIEEKFPWLLKEANGSFFSFELGCVKPDAEIYLTVCSRIKVHPSECMFVDDTSECVAGAVRAGLKAVRFSKTNAAMVRAACGISRAASGTKPAARPESKSKSKSKPGTKSKSDRKPRS